MIETRATSDTVKAPIKLRDYQEEAIAAWVKNDYHGFYVMATGTGKTWTAIYSAKELLKTHPAMVVICAPYKHLVKQWAEDVAAAFPESKIILVSSENPTWETQLTKEIIAKHDDRGAAAVGNIDRFKFYDEAKDCYCILQTGETAIYANIILQKGVIK